MEYQAWGAAREILTQAAQSAGLRNPLRFQGQYHDDESGLHYNRYRYYDPDTGRFISRDPIGLLGGMNVHAYAPNPVEWVDPLGLMGVRKDLYPTRVRSATKRRLEQQATAPDGNMYCPKCNAQMTSQTASVQHEPPLVETHNSIGYNTDQKTRNDLYNSKATELNCLACQKSEGGVLSHRHNYREDTGPNYEPRKSRK